MTAFPLLLAGHLIGDWVVQTDHQAAHKADPGRTGWLANQAHVATYHLTLVVAVLPLALGGASLWRLGIVLAVSYLTHSVIDRRWPVRRLMTVTGSHAFSTAAWGVIAVDQALHLSILALLSYLTG